MNPDRVMKDANEFKKGLNRLAESMRYQNPSREIEKAESRYSLEHKEPERPSNVETKTEVKNTRNGLIKDCQSIRL